MLVQICGLPGSGKSTLTARIADSLPAVVLSIDAIENAMRKYDVEPRQSGIAAYSAAHAIAAPHLRRGQIVLADAVSAVEPARTGWVLTAATFDVELRVIELTCPDQEEHRRRVEARSWPFEHLPRPTWQGVQETMREYEPRTDPRLTINTTEDADLALESALHFITSTTAQNSWPQSTRH